MSNEEVPLREDTRFVYEDKPNAITMLSGGLLMAVFLYWITGILLGFMQIDLPIIQYLIAGLVIIASIQMGRTADVRIMIDTQTGYIEASDKQFEYSGYAHEPERLMVLEKKSSGPQGRTFKDYKLSLKVDEETTFDVPLETSQVKTAIKNVEKAKNSVPINRKS